MNVWTHAFGFLIGFAVFTFLCFTDVGEIASQGHNNIFERIKTDLFDQRRAEFNIFVSVLLNVIREHDSPYTVEDSRLNFEIAESVNKWPLCAFILSACFCLGCSSFCHLCYVKDAKICNMIWALDYQGIAICFLGSVYPQISYKYACGSMVFYRYFFVTIIMICCTICMITTLFPRLTSPPLRVSMYLFFGLSFVAPILFLEYNYNPEIALAPDWMKLAPIGVVYLVGTTLYLTKVPERWLKGQVDYFGSSHNIFHVMILVALILTMKESWALYLKR